MARVIIEDNVYCFEIKTGSGTYRLPLENDNVLIMTQEELFSLLNQRKILELFTLSIVRTEGNKFVVVFNEVNNDG